MNIKNILIKTVSVILTALSVCGIYMLLYLNQSSIPSILIISGCMAAAFIFVSIFSGRFSKKTGNIIFISASLIILLGGIFLTPYNPCHDSLDLHNVMSYMLHNHNDMSEGWYIKTYVNFFINNKFVIYIYIPFVRLFKNAETGIRFLNGIFLIGAMFFISLASQKLLKREYFGSMLFKLSLLSPVLLLSGPYIYLPSIFMGSAAVFFYVNKGIVSRILLFISAAAIFILRPTCFGFLLVFAVLDMFFRFENGKTLIKKAALILFMVIFTFVFKSAAGEVMYRTGLHKYPNMLNAASVWTLELGTRTNGEQTGTCFYTPFEPDDEDIANADNIQKDFYSLWKYYMKDAGENTSNYNNIVNMQTILGRKIIRRALSRTPARFFEHFYLKTVTFFKDTYIPYYYKANLHDENIKIWRNYDKKYFSYMNMIFLLFFLSAIINFITVIVNRDKTKGAVTALSASAVAINIVFLLLTEVQKKYMFDFYVPMAMCIVMTFSFDFGKKLNASLSALIAAALIAAFSFNESLYDIKILRGAKTSFSVNGEESTFSVKMKKPADSRDYYIYNHHSGEKIYLYNRDEFSVTFPTDSFDAFTLCADGTNIKSFSAQKIKN